jgi:hypothetical protein
LVNLHGIGVIVIADPVNYLRKRNAVEYSETCHCCPSSTCPTIAGDVDYLAARQPLVSLVESVEGIGFILR